MTAREAVMNAARDKVWTERFIAFAPWLLDRETVFKRGHSGDYEFATHEDDPRDPGGRTKFGIDQRSHRSTDIAALTVADALAIYWSSYWLPSLADHCPAGYGEIVCDIRVNGGNAWRIVQRGLNDAGAKLVADGVYGRQTAAAMLQIGHAGLWPVLNRREAYYRELAVKRRMGWALKGWLNRNNSLRRLVGA